jgi:hypothetical protein
MDVKRLAHRTLFALLLSSTAAYSQPRELPRVLGPDTQAKAQSIARDTATVQSRSAQPDVVLLDAIARRHARTREATRFVVDLFPGVEVTAEVTAAEVRANGGTTLFARLPDVPLGSAVFTIEAGVLTATVNSPQGNFVVSSNGDGSYRVARKDASLYPPEREPRQAFGRAQPASPFAAADAIADVPADSGRLIDVMIVWTPASQTWGGGAAAMQSLAQAAIDSANAIYFNSGIAQRLRLVHSQQVTYQERSGACGDAFNCGLDDLTDLGDGYIDNIHALRDTHGADMVALLIDDPAACGIAWLISTTSGDPTSAFSVTAWDCAVGNMSFTHELGHNMGAHHDPVTAPPNGWPAAFPYNRGYVAPGSAWRTVMSYGSACGNCPRIAHMSNPKDLNGGAVTGNASVSNNAHVLNKTAKAIAAYRPTSALHPVAQRFSDVPKSHAFYGHIEFFAQAGISTGCAAGQYCPNAPVSRRQMAAFLERPMRSSSWMPSSGQTAFTDVVDNSQFAGEIERLRLDGVTTGCGSMIYCPEHSVTRAQMAVFILRARCGSSYVPNMPASQTFADVPLSHPFVRYIDKLHALGITGGCATGPLRYCPDAAVTRGQMAAFIERAYPFWTPSETCPL